jgi:hypothetical protein
VLSITETLVYWWKWGSIHPAGGGDGEPEETLGP